MKHLIFIFISFALVPQYSFGAEKVCSNKEVVLQFLSFEKELEDVQKVTSSCLHNIAERSNEINKADLVYEQLANLPAVHQINEYIVRNALIAISCTANMDELTTFLTFCKLNKLHVTKKIVKDALKILSKGERKSQLSFIRKHLVYLMKNFEHNGQIEIQTNRPIRSKPHQKRLEYHDYYRHFFHVNYVLPLNYLNGHHI